jgi:hypothetical protein
MRQDIYPDKPWNKAQETAVYSTTEEKRVSVGNHPELGKLFFLLFLSFLHLLTCVYIVWAISFSAPQPPKPPNSRQTLFHSLVL